MKDAILKVFSITLAFVFFLSGCSLTGNKKNKSESTEDDKPVSANKSTEESSEENPATGEIFCKMPEPEHIFYNEENDYCYADNQLLLTANDGVTKEQIEALAVPYGGKIVGCIEVADDYQLEFDRSFTEEEIEETVKQFLSSGIVLDACANRAFRTESGMVANDYVPNDYLWKDENWEKRDKYGINWNAKAIKAQEAWVYRNVMEPVNVGIIDSPFFEYSDDLDFVKIWNNPSRKNVNSVFDDPQNNDFKDKHHGTIIAGVIGASFDNNEGIAGIAPNARLYGAALKKSECKVTDKNLATVAQNVDFTNPDGSQTYNYQDYASFMVWKYFLANMITSGCKVINVSQTNSQVEFYREHLTPFLKKFIDRHFEFLIVSIAGNYGDDDSNSSLAKNLGPFNGITMKEVKDRIIVVGTAGYKGSYCKHGKDNDYGYNMTSDSGYGERVDILAPGVHIYSTLYEDDYNSEYGNCFKGHNGSIYYNTGSSFAAPHVAGVAAMCFGVNPSLTGKQVKEIILSGAKKGDNKIESSHETDTYYYMVDAKEAVQKAIHMNGEKQHHWNDYVVFGTVTESSPNDDKYRKPGASVTAYQMGADGLYSQVSSAETLDSGWYELFLQKGTYTLVFTYPGCAAEVINDFVVSGEESRVQHDVTLELRLENVIISGTVKDQDGRPVADAEITITGGSNAQRGVRLFQTEQGVLEYEIILPDSSPGKDQKTVKTDPNGYYSVEFVQNINSTYTVTAKKDRYASHNSDEIPIEITDSEKDIYYTYDIELKGGGMYKAYCEVVKKLMNQYGEGEYNDRTGNMTGLSVVRLVDFNGDGQEELLCAYSNNSTLHTQEIFCYENGKTYSIYQDKANCSTGGYAPYVNYVVCKNQSYILTEAIASAPAFTRGKWRRIDNGINEVVLDYDGSWDPKDNFNINGEKTNREGFYALINNFKNSGTDYLILLYSSREESTEYIQVGDRVLEETQKTLEKIGYKSEAWKKAYVEYVEDIARQKGSIVIEWVSYALIKIDDDIPELYIGFGEAASGELICTYYDGKVVEQRLPYSSFRYIEDSGFNYIEKENLFIHQYIKRGSYATIYSIIDGQFVMLHSCSYKYSDTGKATYTFDNNVLLSEDDYDRELKKVFDFSRASGVGQQGKNIRSWNDITQAIMKYDAG